MKKWDTLFSIVNEDNDKTIFQEADLKTLHDTINKLSYKKMLIDLSNKVVEVKTNLVSDLSQKRLKLKKEMDEFYTKINSTLSQMKNIDKVKEYSHEVNFS